MTGGAGGLGSAVATGLASQGRTRRRHRPRRRRGGRSRRLHRCRRPDGARLRPRRHRPRGGDVARRPGRRPARRHRHPRGQRRHRAPPPGARDDPVRVAEGHRHQPLRVLLLRPGRRAEDDLAWDWWFDHQHRLGRRAGRDRHRQRQLRRQQGRHDRAHEDACDRVGPAQRQGNVVAPTHFRTPLVAHAIEQIPGVEERFLANIPSVAWASQPSSSEGSFTSPPTNP